MEQDLTLFGEVNFRDRRTRFGIKTDDRRRHMYVIGKTGMGKSELLKTLAIQDIQNGKGLAFVDPHGDPVEDLLDHVPPERIKDVVYVNPADLKHPVAFNVMEQVDYDKRHLVADGVMSVFKKIWTDVWSSRMEYILNNTILALLEIPDATLLGINRMLASKDYRRYVVSQLKDSLVKAFWTQEFAKYTERFAAEATPAIQNKVGQFSSSALIRNIIGQPKSSLDMRKIMDEKKILLVNISKGRIGEDASRLLGALIITKLQLAAMSRVDIPERERKDFTLIVDEFQNFATASFANILSEARKYHLNLVIAHQYVAQMEESVRDAVFGNVGTIVAFRVGAEDAELLEKELAPEFFVKDIVNLGKRQIYLKLMIDGLASRAFSAQTMDTPAPLPQSLRQEIINYSHQHYSTPVAEVEKYITQWLEMIFPREEEDFSSFPPAERGRTFYNDSRRSPSNDRGETRDRGFSLPRSETRPRSDSYPAVHSGRSFPASSGIHPGFRRADSPSAESDRGTNAAPATPGGRSLSQTLKEGVVDFRGRKIPVESRIKEVKNEEKKSRPAVDVEKLRQTLKSALKQNLPATEGSSAADDEKSTPPEQE